MNTVNFFYAFISITVLYQSTHRLFVEIQNTLLHFQIIQIDYLIILYWSPLF